MKWQMNSVRYKWPATVAKTILPHLKLVYWEPFFRVVGYI